RDCPCFLDQSLDLTRMASDPLGLLPFCQSEVARIAVLFIDQPARHLPAVLKVELSGNLLKLVFKERERLCRHGFGIDPAPNGMAMATPFFFMEDDNARLIVQAMFIFDGLKSRFKRVDA